jgi:transposase-like protein
MKTNPGKSFATTAPARRKYDDEFKRQALQMVRDGQPVRSVAQALGISENMLHQWKRSATSRDCGPRGSVSAGAGCGV